MTEEAEKGKKGKDEGKREKREKFWLNLSVLLLIGVHSTQE